MFCQKKKIVYSYLKNADFPATLKTSSALTKTFCRVIFDGFGSNWFKLVSAQPPNSQIFYQKKILYFTSSWLLDQILLLPEIWWCLLRWRAHGGVKQISIQIISKFGWPWGLHYQYFLFFSSLRWVMRSSPNAKSVVLMILKITFFQETFIFII